MIRVVLERNDGISGTGKTTTMTTTTTTLWELPTSALKKHWTIKKAGVAIDEGRQLPTNLLPNFDEDDTSDDNNCVNGTNTDNGDGTDDDRMNASKISPESSSDPTNRTTSMSSYEDNSNEFVTEQLPPFFRFVKPPPRDKSRNKFGRGNGGVRGNTAKSTNSTTTDGGEEDNIVVEDDEETKLKVQDCLHYSEYHPHGYLLVRSTDQPIQRHAGSFVLLTCLIPILEIIDNQIGAGTLGPVMVNAVPFAGPTLYVLLNMTQELAKQFRAQQQLRQEVLEAITFIGRIGRDVAEAAKLVSPSNNNNGNNEAATSTGRQIDWTILKKLMQELHDACKETILKRHALWSARKDLARLQDIQKRVQQELTITSFQMTVQTTKKLQEVQEQVQQQQNQLQQQLYQQQQQQQQQRRPPPPQELQSLLPDSPPLVGRNDELQELFGKTSAGTVTAVCALAGCGKSHLCKSFVRQWIDNVPTEKRLAFWLHAETESDLRLSYQYLMEKILRSSLTNLTETSANNNGDNVDRLSTSEMAAQIWKELTKLDRPWMVIMDNVPETDGSLSNFASWFFPLNKASSSRVVNEFGHGRILLSSRLMTLRGRTAALGNMTVQQVRLEPMQADDAVEMLLEDLYYDEDDEDEINAAHELVGPNYLDGLPLAIASARARIIDLGDVSVREFLDDVKENKEDDHSSAILVVLEGTLRHAQEQGLGNIVAIATYANPDQIERELLGGESNRRAIQALVKLNLFRTVGKGTYSMHRMFQDAARNIFDPTEAIVNLTTLTSKFDGFDSRTWDLGWKLYAHCESLFRHITFDVIGEYGLDQGMLSDIALFAGYVSHYCFHDYSSAASWFDKARTFVRGAGESDEIRLKMGNILQQQGMLYRRLCKYERSQECLNEALVMKLSVYGEGAKNTDIAITKAHLGLLYKFSRKTDESLQCFHDALEMQQDEMGNNISSPELAFTLTNLGLIYAETGKYEQAENYLRDAFDTKREIYGMSSKNTSIAMSLDSLGKLHKLKGDKKMKPKKPDTEHAMEDYEEALRCYEEALEIKRMVYGPDTKTTPIATSLESIARLLKSMGKPEQALSYFEEALEIKRVTSGEPSVPVAQSLKNLGKLYNTLGDYDRSLSISQESSAMFFALFGKK